MTTHSNTSGFSLKTAKVKNGIKHHKKNPDITFQVYHVLLALCHDPAKHDPEIITCGRQQTLVYLYEINQQITS